MRYQLRDVANTDDHDRPYEARHLTAGQVLGYADGPLRQDTSPAGIRLLNRVIALLRLCTDHDRPLPAGTALGVTIRHEPTPRSHR